MARPLLRTSRGEVVDLIATHLARMPGGVAISPADADSPPEAPPQNPSENSPTGREVPELAAMQQMTVKYAEFFGG